MPDTIASLKHVSPVIGGVIVAIFAIAFIPVNQQRTISEGVDSFETHRALYSNHVFSQDIQTHGSIVGVGTIVVDLFKSQSLTPVIIHITDIPNQSLYGASFISPHDIADDEFAVATFDEPIRAPHKVRINFLAPDATSKNAIGVRYDPDVTDHSLPRLEDGTLKPGIFAITVIERVPFWRFIQDNIQLHPDRWKIAAASVGIALLLSIISMRLGWRYQPKHIRRAIEIGIIISITCLALNSRLSIIPQFKGVSGGDPYNYLSITQRIARFENPFAGAKRLPGYPLLLVPSFVSTSMDDQTYMRLISAVSATGVIIMLALLARSLHLPWSVQLIAPALLAWQKDFFWISLRPEPYALYAFLLLASLVLFFRATTPSRQILFGIVLGYTAMTRQEGLVVAIILFIASALLSVSESYRDRKNSKFSIFNFPAFTKATAGRQFSKLLRLFLPALLIVLPFFVHNTLQYGNPIFTPYFKGERLQIVDSWEAFKDASGAAWGVVGSMWKPVWDQLERYALSDVVFIVTFFVTIAWWLAWHKRHSIQTPWLPWAISVVALVLIVFTFWINIAHTPIFSTIFPHVAASIMLASIIPFLMRAGRSGVIVFVVLASQLLIATWFHPFPKHYQQSFPLIMLLVASILTASPSRSRVAITFTRSAFLLPFISITFFLYGSIIPAIDKYNAKVAPDTVVYQAVQKARSLEGPYGIDQDYLPARLYLGEQSVYFTEEHSSARDEQLTWVRDHNIKTLIATNMNSTFLEPEPDWQEVFNIKSEGKNERMFESWVYQLPSETSETSKSSEASQYPQQEGVKQFSNLTI